MRFIPFLFVCFFVVGLVSGYPAYQGWVNDYASVLTPSDATLLGDAFAELEQNTSAEVVFVSVPDTEGKDLFTYAHGLASTWKVGKEDKDNGVVMVYAVDTKKFFVVVGDGMEGILPDGKLGRYLDEWYVPARDGGNLSEGLVLFSSALVNEIMAHADEVRSGQMQENTIDSWGEVFILFVIIALFIWFWWYMVYGPGKRRFGVFPLFIGGGRSSSGFGGGGGFGGFGGGHFSGGGAGR